LLKNIEASQKTGLGRSEPQWLRDPQLALAYAERGVALTHRDGRRVRAARVSLARVSDGGFPADLAFAPSPQSKATHGSHAGEKLTRRTTGHGCHALLHLGCQMGHDTQHPLDQHQLTAVMHFVFLTTQ
jgi:hypothetical protein